MHNTLKKALCAMIFFIFSSFGQQTAEKALEQKLEGVEKIETKKVSKTEIKKSTRVKSALELECESYPDPRDQAVCFKAQSLEMAKKASELNKKTKTSEPDSMKKVRRDIEREERNERKSREAEAKAYGNAELSGCEPGTVWVSRRATQRSMFRVMSLVRITNIGTLPINIESPLYGGELVRNLCSGGSVTLSFVLAWEDPDQLQIPLTAVSRPEDGGLATDQFSSYLSKWDVQYNRVRTQTWQVRLSRQYQVR